MSDPMAEIMASFFVECEELLEALVDALQSLADGKADDETINIAFRAVHSIKGGAGAFGLEDLVGFAHQFETAMDLCRSGALATDEKLIESFFRCADTLSDLVKAARDDFPADETSQDALIEELAAYCRETPDTAEPIEFAPLSIEIEDLVLPVSTDAAEPIIHTISALPSDGEAKAKLRITFRPTPELYASGNEPRSLLKSLASVAPFDITAACDPVTELPDTPQMGSHLIWTLTSRKPVAPNAVREVFEFVEDLCSLTIETLADIPTHKVASSPLSDPPASNTATITSKQPPATHTTKPGVGATVRVDVERIDRLVNLVGELVINQAMLSQSIGAERMLTNSSIQVGLEEFLQLTRDIQESVMMIRAQPVKSLFQRMSRITREASAAIGKPVRLVTEGETTEIDKTAIERLADPLTHMIRNAVDHGLEAPDVRSARGKPEQGEIRLSAFHRSGRVIIEVADDGAGIDREKVRSIAIGKGLISSDVSLSDAETDQLLFLPGFSTADKVSNLSGRGVGMDVVKTQIAALGGKVTIESDPGQGTTFVISLPLTLAVLDGMVVSVAGETIVVPLGSIVETLSVTAANHSIVSPGAHVLQVRDRFVPLLDLAARLGYRAPNRLEPGGIALLITSEEDRLVALLVDSIDDQRQVVIKGLQESYGHVPGIAAATILGDGQIALILDPSDLALDRYLEDEMHLGKAS